MCSANNESLFDFILNNSKNIFTQHHRNDFEFIRTFPGSTKNCIIDDNLLTLKTRKSSSHNDGTYDYPEIVLSINNDNFSQKKKLNDLEKNFIQVKECNSEFDTPNFQVQQNTENNLLHKIKEIQFEIQEIFSCNYNCMISRNHSQNQFTTLNSNKSNLDLSAASIKNNNIVNVDKYYSCINNKFNYNHEYNNNNLSHEGMSQPQSYSNKKFKISPIINNNPQFTQFNDFHIFQKNLNENESIFISNLINKSVTQQKSSTHDQNCLTYEDFHNVKSNSYHGNNNNHNYEENNLSPTNLFNSYKSKKKLPVSNGGLDIKDFLKVELNIFDPKHKVNRTDFPKLQTLNNKKRESNIEINDDLKKEEIFIKKKRRSYFHFSSTMRKKKYKYPNEIDCQIKIKTTKFESNNRGINFLIKEIKSDDEEERVCSKLDLHRNKIYYDFLTNRNINKYDFGKKPLQSLNILLNRYSKMLKEKEFLKISGLKMEKIDERLRKLKDDIQLMIEIISDLEVIIIPEEEKKQKKATLKENVVCKLCDTKVKNSQALEVILPKFIKRKKRKKMLANY